MPQLGRDVLRAQVYIEQSLQPRFPDVNVVDLQEAWRDILKRAKLVQHHKITREELSVREHMSMVLRKLQGRKFVEFENLFDADARRAGADRHLHRHAGAGQGNADRADAGRGLRADLRAPGLPARLTTMPCVTPTRHSRDFDVLIVGSGLAGLSAALHLAPTHRVAVLTKRAHERRLQRLGAGRHRRRAGRGRQLRRRTWTTRWWPAPACPTRPPPASWSSTRPRASPGCASWACPSPQEDGHLHLTREGGHSARRIVHVTDATGAAVQRTLIERVRAHAEHHACSSTTRWST